MMQERLRYVQPGQKGYHRIRKAKGFAYLDETGQPLTDAAALERIRGLVLPPAWEDVWISPWPNGHLQATGIDALGRKQYRYHADWNKTRSEKKFHRLLSFGKRLPQIRARIRADLHHRELDKQKVIAIALRTMEETLIRVGNASYEKLYGSYGLTTLHNRHVTIQGQKALFRFKGKKGVFQKIELKEAHLVKLLQKVMDIPGQELFQYHEADGGHKPLDSGDVNDYLKDAAGDDFTCKDFRTWAGSVYAMQLLSGLEPYRSAAECKRHVVEVVTDVSCRLGNTATVCKKYYIDPRLITAYETGVLEPFLQKLRSPGAAPKGKSALHSEERIFLLFLQKHAKERKRA